MLEVHPVVVVADRPGDDERRPRLIDQHRVDFVDDGVEVRPLHALVERVHHVVAQVIEAELVVRSVGDVRVVGGAALGRARLGVVEARDREPEVGVQVPHPLRVAAGEVRVDRHQVRALPGERIEVERQRGDEGFAFAGRHLGDLAEVQLDAAHELHVVVHHVPRELVAGHHHRRSDEAAGGFAHGGERLGKNLVEHFGELLAEIAVHAAAAVGAAQLRVDPLALGGVGRRALLLPELGNARFERVGALANDRAKLGRLGPKLVVGHVAQPRVVLVGLVDDRLDFFPVTLVTGAHHGVDHSLEHAILYRYSCSAAMYAATASGTYPRIDFPSRTRCLISVDEMSTRRVARNRAALAPNPVPSRSLSRATSASLPSARRRMTSVASSRIRFGSRHLSNVPTTSAPASRNRSADGHRSANAESVSTV